jgi:hypothetical protein
MSDVASIVVPIGVAVIAVGSALAGSLTGARNDKKRWLREERRQAYAALLDAIHAGALAGDLRSAKSTVNLVRVLGPKRADELADSLFQQALVLKVAREDPVTRADTAATTLSIPGASPDYEKAVKKYYKIEYDFAVEARKTLN